MGVDLKYGRVTTERGNIADDEPVIVFRATDELTLPLLEVYRTLSQVFGASVNHRASIGLNIEVFRRWQEQHKDQTKVPDTTVAQLSEMSHAERAG